MQNDRLNHSIGEHRSHGDAPILPSRRTAFEELVAFWVERRSDRALLTGSSGAGKSWLWRSAAERARSLDDSLRWVWVPHLPGYSGEELLGAILTALGHRNRNDRLRFDRVLDRVERRIRELHEDGFRVEVVIEESHHLGRDGFEVLRILQDRMQSAAIEVGVLYVGQTPLTHRFDRLRRVPTDPGWHLKHVTMPETLALLRWLGGSQRSWSRAEADWIHREALGNPGRILRWAQTVIPAPEESDKPMIKPGWGHEPSGLSRPGDQSPMWVEPLIPTRPPLSESEGVIEVGYDEGTEITEPDREDFLTSEANPEQVGTIDRDDSAPDGASRYRFEPGESFAPYGLNVARGEPAPESGLDA